jgi:hypothetical protein
LRENNPEFAADFTSKPQSASSGRSESAAGRNRNRGNFVVPPSDVVVAKTLVNNEPERAGEAVTWSLACEEVRISQGFCFALTLSVVSIC